VNLPNFVPMSKDDWKRIAESLNPLLSADFALFVEMHNQPIAFALALPDINMALWHCNGLRYPWNYIQLWWHSRHLPGLSFKIMAMLPEYHGLGLDALIYEHLAFAAYRHGYKWIDMSLTGANNPTTNKLAERIKAKIDKRYRVYEYRIT
jgi:GNAT superfamily N-acetyltransferase